MKVSARAKLHSPLSPHNATNSVVSSQITCPAAAATQNISLGKVRWGLSASADESAISGSSEGLTAGGSRLRQLLLRAEVETDSNMKVRARLQVLGSKILCTNHRPGSLSSGFWAFALVDMQVQIIQ